MSAPVTFAEATRQAMHEEMSADANVFLMGEDLAKQGGIFGQFKGLSDSFGEARVRDTPISESVIVSCALGAALTGSRPVVDMHFADFATCAMDEIVNQIAKVSYMFGGQASAPLVIRMPDGVINSAAAQHSQSLEAWFAHVPGLIVVAPATPMDAKGLLKSAIRANDPVLYLEHKAMYTLKGEVGEADHYTPFGQARLARAGSDVTVVSWSRMLHRSLSVAHQLAEQGTADVEVIDLRSIAPFDLQAVLNSVRKTGRLVIVHEACVAGGFGAEIASQVQFSAFRDLKAPIRRVGNVGVPIPFAPDLERAAIPSESVIANEILECLA